MTNWVVLISYPSAGEALASMKVFVSLGKKRAEY
jgi:hypothetical protein